MSGLLFLNATDLTHKSGEKGTMLCISPEPKGMTLVMFYSKDCEHCKTLFSNFKQLPYFVTGCQFAIFNVDLNPQIVELSKPTICPITYVPDVILYVNGSPYIRYDGDHDTKAIQTFLQQIYEKLQKTSFFKSSENQYSSSYPPPPVHNTNSSNNFSNLRTGTQSRGTEQFTDPRVDFQQNQQIQQPAHPQAEQNPYVQQASGNRMGPLPPLSKHDQGGSQHPHAPQPIQYQQQTEHYQSSPSSQSSNNSTPTNNIPAYTIGKPVCSGPDEKCYLAFGDAYGKNNNSGVVM
jgi:hypothetical protein